MRRGGITLKRLYEYFGMKNRRMTEIAQNSERIYKNH